MFYTFLVHSDLTGQEKPSGIPLIDISEIHQLADKLIDRNKDSSVKLLDIAYAKIIHEKDDNLRRKYLAYNHIMKAYINDSKLIQIKASDSLAHLAFNYFIKTRDNYGLSKVYQVLGNLRDTEGKIKEAIYYKEKALKAALMTSEPVLITRMYYDKGITLVKTGDLNPAFECAFSAMKYAKLSQDTLSLFFGNFLLGVLNYHFKSYNKAEQYLTAANTFALKSLDSVYYTTFAAQYAEAMLRNGKRQKSIQIFEKVLDYAVRHHKICEALYLYSMLGESLVIAKEDQRAKKYFEESRSFASEFGASSSYYFLYLAKIYALMDEKEKAIEHMEKFLSLDQENKNQGEGFSNINLYKYLASIYEEIDEPDKAFLYYKKYSSIADSIYASNSRLLLAEMERRYQLEKKRNAEAMDQKLALSESKNRQLWLSGTLLFVLTAGGSMIYYLSFKSHKEKEKFKLHMKGNQLTQVLQAQEEERKRLARELHDGVGQTLAALKMKLQMTNCNQPSLQVIQSVDALCKEVRSLSHQMMPMVLQENGLKEALEWLVDQSFSNSNIKVDLIINKFTDRLNSILEVHIYRIVQELLNNILKHSNASDIGIQLLQREEKVFLIIEDNGKGFHLSQKYEGIGLANIHSRIASLSGKMEIQSEPGGGTFVRIVIPLSDQNKLSA